MVVVKHDGDKERNRVSQEDVTTQSTQLFIVEV